jgi:phage protein U
MKQIDLPKNNINQFSITSIEKQKKAIFMNGCERKKAKQMKNQRLDNAGFRIR